MTSAVDPAAAKIARTLQWWVDQGYERKELACRFDSRGQVVSIGGLPLKALPADAWSRFLPAAERLVELGRLGYSRAEAFVSLADGSVRYIRRIPVFSGK